MYFVIAIALGVLCVALSVASGLGTLVLAVVATVLACAAVEAGRRLAGPERWWIAYLGIGPWVLLVPLPWSYFVLQGDWSVAGLHIDPELPLTWQLHVMALAGFGLGTLAGLAIGSAPHNRLVAEHKAVGLRSGRLNRAMALLLAIYGASFMIAGRPLAAFWTLSGPVTYGTDADARTGLLLLDLSVVTASVTLLVYAAGRRSLRRWPALGELGWLSTYIVVSLGSGVRGRLFLLVIGWGIIQFSPEMKGVAGRPRRLVTAVVCSVALVVAFQATTLIAEERVRATPQGGSVLRRSVESTEVIGSGEALLKSNVALGVLGGESYMELPRLVIPAKLVGGTKEGPAADELVRDRLVEGAGYSAPLWFEAALNFGATGTFVFSTLYALGAVSVLRRLRRRLSEFALGAVALGPVWLLISYTALKRLTLFQALVLTGASLIGIRLGSRTVMWHHPTGLRPVGSARFRRTSKTTVSIPWKSSVAVSQNSYNDRKGVW